MKIPVLILKSEGTILKSYILPSIDSVRLLLKGTVDNINLFTDVQAFIRRDEKELKSNVFVPGVYGDILLTGGKGSYLTGLTVEQETNILKLFRRERAKNGKT